MKVGYVLLGLVALTSLHISSGQCDNGLAGVQSGDICCEADCGTCGGYECSDRAGGASACCRGPIRDSGEMCSATMAAPCIIDDKPEDPNPTCSNGFPGVQSGSICCADFCGRCGGRGCANIPNGEHNCCMRTINKMCSETMEAPCVIDEEEVPEFCSNGVPGVEQDGSCCAAECGTCGGNGCASRPGGRDSCCTGRIQDSGIFCSDTLVSPCIMD